jgi:hypothetical protein
MVRLRRPRSFALAVRNRNSRWPYNFGRRVNRRRFENQPVHARMAHAYSEQIRFFTTHTWRFDLWRMRFNYGSFVLVLLTLER